MATPNPTEIGQISRAIKENHLGFAVDDARELADQIGASAVHAHVLNAATHVDDAQAALSDGVAR